MIGMPTIMRERDAVAPQLQEFLEHDRPTSARPRIGALIAAAARCRQPCRSMRHEVDEDVLETGRRMRLDAQRRLRRRELFERRSAERRLVAAADMQRSAERRRSARRLRQCAAAR